MPRDTKTLVASVAKRKAEDPDLINGLLAEIQNVSESAVAILDNSIHLTRSQQISKLESLLDSNHALLNKLGVSHASLEAVKTKAEQKPYGLHTKLTGAGGGGCAVTIVPDGEKRFTCQAEGVG